MRHLLAEEASHVPSGVRRRCFNRRVCSSYRSMLEFKGSLLQPRPSIDSMAALSDVTPSVMHVRVHALTMRVVMMAVVGPRSVVVKEMLLCRTTPCGVIVVEKFGAVLL